MREILYLVFIFLIALLMRTARAATPVQAPARIVVGGEGLLR